MRNRAYAFRGSADFFEEFACYKKNTKLDSKNNKEVCKKLKSKEVFRHKKSLGQNFLHDEAILYQIIQSIPSNVSQSIVSQQIRLIEVGIGLGDLTKFLLNKYSVLAYEVDGDLIARAQHAFQTNLADTTLVLEQQDVLKMHKGDGYLFDSPYFLVSNLPYYIATAIILQALKDHYCMGFLVMTQREVAQKFCAEHKSSEFCALSVLAQSFGSVEYLFDVPPSAFNPPPKVHSAVFCFQRKHNYYTQDLESLLHSAFLAPRKKLISNLISCNKGTKDQLEELFAVLNIPITARPHEISMQEYCKIAHILKRINNE